METFQLLKKALVVLLFTVLSMNCSSGTTSHDNNGATGVVGNNNHSQASQETTDAPQIESQKRGEEKAEAASQQTAGGLKGILVNEKYQKPIPHRSLQLFEYNELIEAEKTYQYVITNEKPPTAESDRNGEFFFEGVPVGKYTIGFGRRNHKTIASMENSAMIGNKILVIEIGSGQTKDIGTVYVRK